VVNVSGSFVLGVVTGAALYHGLPVRLRLWVGTGLCGAYTTFSTLAVDTVHLVGEGDLLGALANAGVSCVAGTLAAALGLALAWAV
jgi:CrcB protein